LYSKIIEILLPSSEIAKVLKRKIHRLEKNHREKNREVKGLKKNYTYRLSEPFLPPTEEYLNLLREVWETRYLTNGKLKGKAEKEIASLTGAKYNILVNSGTTALELGLKALKLKTGKAGAILVPAYTFIATLTAVLNAGYEPYLIDVEPERWTLHPDLSIKAIRSLKSEGTEVSAILTVDPFGFPSEYDKLLNISEITKVPLISDSSEALGTLYKGRRVGAIATFHSFSFSPTKVITSGEGGLVSTTDPEIAEIVKGLVNYGYPLYQKFGLEGIRNGTNGRMSELNAALLLLGIRDFQRLREIRLNQYLTYRTCLGKLGFKGQKLSEDIALAPSYAVFLTPSQDSEPLIKCLRERGIEAKRYFIPLNHFLPTNSSYPVAQALYNRSMALPLGPHLKEGDVKNICHALEGLLKRGI